MTSQNLDLQSAAREAAGNWRDFDSFYWSGGRDLPDSDNWTIVYTHNRDSGLIDQSNAETIRKALEPYTEGDDPDVVEEHHTHWAVGWVDGYSIRVYRDGVITPAFSTYYDLMDSIADYPILDENNYSLKEYEATLENIEFSGSFLKGNYDLPDQWAIDAYSWLVDNRPGSVENVDDRGGCPEEDDLMAAFDALGWAKDEDEDEGTES